MPNVTQARRKAAIAQRSIPLARNQKQPAKRQGQDQPS
jgi:hypothetical protein